MTFVGYGDALYLELLLMTVQTTCRHIQVLELLQQLVPVEDQVPDNTLGTLEPAPHALLVAAKPYELDGYAELWEQNETEANERLVDWFARHAERSVKTFRRFIVVHTVDNSRWKDTYQLMDVTTPEKYERKYMRSAGRT